MKTNLIVYVDVINDILKKIDLKKADDSDLKKLEKLREWKRNTYNK